MRRVRGLAAGVMALSLLAIAGLARPASVSATDPAQELTATLDGRPIPLGDVAKYDCDDFSYPEIQCWSTRVLAESRATLVTLLTSIEYVTVYDYSAFSGPFMNVSQDYSALALFGWNDRISSFKARNGETGTFFNDWFYGGAWYTFCCNTQVSNLGVYSNTFSSIRRS